MNLIQAEKKGAKPGNAPEILAAWRFGVELQFLVGETWHLRPYPAHKPGAHDYYRITPKGYYD